MIVYDPIIDNCNTKGITGDGCGASDAYSYQLYDVCETLFHECSEERPDSELVI